MEKALASYIDHTLLKPDCKKSDIDLLCQEALEHHFYAICIPPYFVNDARYLLEDSAIKISTVIGFPYGNNATIAKIEEIKRAINDGADEIDAVINLNALKSGHWNYVENDIGSIINMTHLKGKKIKLILEPGLLTPYEMKRLSEIVMPLAPNFVKTSTGVIGPGATPEMIQQLRSLFPGTIAIKASGGIRTLEQAKAMIAAGADRIGTSSGISMV